MMLKLYFYKYDQDYEGFYTMNSIIVVNNNKSISGEFLINKTMLDDEQ